MMIYYVFLYGGYVILSLLVLSVYVLLVVGAVKELRWFSGRVSRLQLEGAVIMLACTLSRWVVLDPVVLGMDPLESNEWTYWFKRGETGLFLVGLILFGLGFFLSRRPRPGLKPWDAGLRRLAVVSLILGVGLVILLWFYFQASWFRFPLGNIRMLFGVALYPFAIGYLKQERNPAVPPPESTDVI